MDGIGYDITLNGTSIANGQTVAGVETIVLPGASSGQYEVILDAAEINRRGYLSVNGACGLLNPGDLCNQVGGLTPLAAAPNNQPGSDIQILIGLFGDDNRNNTQDANEPWMDGIHYDILKDGANIGSGTTTNGVDTSIECKVLGNTKLCLMLARSTIAGISPSKVIVVCYQMAVYVTSSRC